MNAKDWLLSVFLAVGMLAAIWLPLAVQAQGPIKLEKLEIDLWPEYDKPSVLVIYHIALPAGTSLPADLSLRIPKESGSPNAVAARQTDDSLVNLIYEVQPQQGDWSLLTFSATTLEVQVEYYDNRLVKDNDQRQFEYTWPGDYAIEQLTLQVQQPIGAGQMAISPDLGAGEQAPDNLVYYTSNVGSVPEGQPVEISIEYIKAGDELSVDTLPIQSSEPISTPAATQSINQMAPWLIGGLGVLLLGGGAYWYWRTGQQRHPDKTTRNRHRTAGDRPAGETRAPVETRPSGGEAAIYCHQCGKRANPGDRFCRICGTPLKT